MYLCYFKKNQGQLCSCLNFTRFEKILVNSVYLKKSSVNCVYIFRIQINLRQYLRNVHYSVTRRDAYLHTHAPSCRKFVWNKCHSIMYSMKKQLLSRAMLHTCTAQRIPANPAFAHYTTHHPFALTLTSFIVTTVLWFMILCVLSGMEFHVATWLTYEKNVILVTLNRYNAYYSRVRYVSLCL